MAGAAVNTLITVVATLVAAFGGAYFAFKLEHKRQVEKERNIRIEKAYKLRLSLIWCINTLGNIETNIKNMQKKGMVEYLPIPVSGLNSFRLPIELDYLDSILPLRDEELAFAILFSLRRTQAIIEMLFERAEIQNNDVQPIIEALQKKNPNVAPDRKEIEEAIGQRIRVNMCSLTQTIITDVEKEHDLQYRILDWLDKSLSKIYPEIELRDIAAKPSLEDEH